LYQTGERSRAPLQHGTLHETVYARCTACLWYFTAALNRFRGSFVLLLDVRYGMRAGCRLRLGGSPPRIKTPHSIFHPNLCDTSRATTAVTLLPLQRTRVSYMDAFLQRADVWFLRLFRTSPHVQVTPQHRKFLLTCRTVRSALLDLPSRRISFSPALRISTPRIRHHDICRPFFRRSAPAFNARARAYAPCSTSTHLFPYRHHQHCRDLLNSPEARTAHSALVKERHLSPGGSPALLPLAKQRQRYRHFTPTGSPILARLVQHPPLPACTTGAPLPIKRDSSMERAAVAISAGHSNGPRYLRSPRVTSCRYQVLDVTTNGGLCVGRRRTGGRLAALAHTPSHLTLLAPPAVSTR